MAQRQGLLKSGFVYSSNLSVILTAAFKHGSYFIKPKFSDLDVTCKYKELVFQELIAWQKVKNN